ncbi:hypothetical protein LTR54_013801 [Friedmanniomyces endolithicus]|uniref:Amino acid permease/ SLC12A domain-containing protein n=1 Tax=Friedmanniomyces endolithicus TaxID=329885 RepID=A0AAN6J943_9PEZI|nr:hypothetical protein LTS00_002480 [Friedmanniomyces endolithicus]KAK0321428.1 hypothetical protein LTR82_007396 [Friedmanniomyces endolithicus]KAK0985406.1 hypothetical protein LTR54_013801 [Friedmanniomyces endolithicus]
MMDDMKETNHDAYELRSPPESQSPGDNFGSNDRDQANMARMGKDQEMKRVFRQVSLISFTAIIMGTWQWMLMANTQGLINGGRGGLFWSYIWTLAGYGLLAASLADMASMCPTAGGQYHWVSEFSPPKHQQVLSYVSGWLSALSWQAGNASGLFLCAKLIQALIAIGNPAYAAPAWQGWLLVVAVTLICVFFNIFAEPLLPHMQNLFLPVYVGAFIATVAVMCALCPHVDAYTALIEITNEGGWSSSGLALMVGQISAIFALGGSDAAAHMSEEVRDAGLSVPRAMIGSILLNGIIGFIALIPFLSALPSIDDAVSDPSGFPLVYVLNLAGMPNVTIGLIFLQLLILMVGNVAYQAATGRQTFAFARDGGMPFSKWIGHINLRYHLPVNAVLLTAIITLVLCLINLGSSDAFNAILSLAAVAQMATYSISISCVLYRRLTAPHLLPKAQWGLGQWGVPVNAAGAAYAWFAFFWAFWPSATPVSATSMNYAVVMFGGVMILAMLYFVVKARKSYAGPVTRTEAYLAGKLT